MQVRAALRWRECNYISGRMPLFDARERNYAERWDELAAEACLLVCYRTLAVLLKLLPSSPQRLAAVPQRSD